MDLDMDGYVTLCGTAKKDSVIKGNDASAFDEDSFDFDAGGCIGGPVDVKGGKEEGA